MHLNHKIFLIGYRRIVEHIALCHNVISGASHYENGDAHIAADIYCGVFGKGLVAR